jgi:hypothetical protein
MMHAPDARPHGQSRAGLRDPPTEPAIALAALQRRADGATVLPLAIDRDTAPMTTAQILMLAAEALAYDAVVVLWVSRYGTQPVLMPRSLGQPGRRRDRSEPKTRTTSRVRLPATPDRQHRGS